MADFDAVAGLTDEETRLLIRGLTPSTLATVLSNASPAVSHKFFSNMRFDIAAMIRETMEKLGNLTQAEIETRRGQVLEVLQSLKAAGKIKGV